MTQASNLAKGGTNFNSTGNLSLTTGVTGILPVANGGTGTSTGVAPGGSTTQVQYNNAGAFGGDSGFVYTGGNVGIGTASPAAKFQTNSTDGTIAIFRTTSGANNSRINVDISDSAATAGFAVGGNSSFPAMTFANGGSERMRITSAGYVGINNTAAPVLGYEKLGVSGSGAFSTTGTTALGLWNTTNAGLIQFFSTGSGTNAGSIEASGASLSLIGGSSLTLTASGANPLIFNTNSAERMRITSAGGVSFGSSGTAYGTTGQVLTSNGNAAPTWGSSIVSGTAVASTSGTNFDYTAIPSWVKRITVMFSGVSGNGSSNILIQLGTGSTTYTTSGYNSTSTWGNATVTSATTGLVILNDSSGYAFSGQMVITNITGNTWVQSHQGKSSTGALAAGGGDIALGAALTAVRITRVNGTDTFDAGTINILYE